MPIIVIISGPTPPMITPKGCLLSLWSGEHERLAQRSEVGTVTELFCEYILKNDFYCNVEDLYLFHMDAFYDVVIENTDVFH